MIFAVYSGWRGNGAEAVFVEAEDEPAAIQAAREALIADAEQNLVHHAGRPIASHHQERLDDYRSDEFPKSVHQVVLPWIGEVG